MPILRKRLPDCVAAAWPNHWLNCVSGLGFRSSRCNAPKPYSRLRSAIAISQNSEFRVLSVEFSGAAQGASRLGTRNAERGTESGVRRDHSLLTRVVEQAARVHDRPHVAERHEGMRFARRLNCDHRFVEIDGDHIAVFEKLAHAFQALARIHFAGRDAIAEENAGETFSQDNFAASGTKRDGRVFARTAATKILSGNHDVIFAVELTSLHIADGVLGIRQAAEGVRAEL